jgi:hypothetical protein
VSDGIQLQATLALFHSLFIGLGCLEDTILVSLPDGGFPGGITLALRQIKSLRKDHLFFLGGAAGACAWGCDQAAVCIDDAFVNGGVQFNRSKGDDDVVDQAIQHNSKVLVALFATIIANVTSSVNEITHERAVLQIILFDLLEPLLEVLQVQDIATEVSVVLKILQEAIQTCLSRALGVDAVVFFLNAVEVGLRARLDAGIKAQLNTFLSVFKLLLARIFQVATLDQAVKTINRATITRRIQAVVQQRSRNRKAKGGVEGFVVTNTKTLLGLVELFNTFLAFLLLKSGTNTASASESSCGA